MSRVLSGVQPTGEITLGNYLGTMKQWPDHQDEAESLFFIADLHALNTRPAPDELKKRTLEAVAWLLALGVNPTKATIFVESQVGAHAQLLAILNNFATMGELSRMTQFKEKSQKHGQSVGLFEYPVLMAADILLYDAAFVPVGDDQKQHLEFCREVAERFNRIYGNIFTIPEPIVQKQGARIMDLLDPSKKMSKSDQGAGYILLTDSDDEISSKIKRAVTDSATQISSGKDRPAMTNLLSIFSLATGRAVDELENSFHDTPYDKFKTELADALISLIRPIRQRYLGLVEADDEISKVLSEGQSRASAIADKKLQEVKKVIGLL